MLGEQGLQIDERGLQVVTRLLVYLEYLCWLRGRALLLMNPLSSCRQVLLDSQIDLTRLSLQVFNVRQLV